MVPQAMLPPNCTLPCLSPCLQSMILGTQVGSLVLALGRSCASRQHPACLQHSPGAFSGPPGSALSPHAPARLTTSTLQDPYFNEPGYASMEGSAQ